MRLGPHRITCCTSLALNNESHCYRYARFDSGHGAIDIANLQLREAPEAPTAPTVTAPTFDSIRIALSADPTSDATITSRDIRWKRTADSAWTEVEGVTSPHTVSSGIVEQTEYEAQWRAVSAAGDGAWSPSFAVTTPAENTAPEITFNAIANMVDGGQVLSLSGTFSDDQGNSTATVTVAATLGTISNVSQNNTAGTWSATWTAPASTASSQDVTITATATDDEGETDTATRMTTVRGDLMPSLPIILDIVLEQGTALSRTLAAAVGRRHAHYLHHYRPGCRNAV